MSAAWPVVLTEGPVTLRPLRYRDARAWRRVRSANNAWLAPWEATSPTPDTPLRSFHQMVHELNRQGRVGGGLPLAVEVDEQLAGQVTVSTVAWGSLRGGSIGYWVDSGVAGRGVMPTAVAMVVDHCFGVLGMHRLEVNIRPENAASLRVVAKLGFRDEGLRERFLHIDGAWRDHRTFALTVEDVPGGLLPRWRAYQAARASGTAGAGGPDEPHESHPSLQ